MKPIKIKQSQKGFTLIEILLVITLISILLTIGLVQFNIDARFVDARNDIRKTHIQTLEGAITQYRLQEGSYPTGLNRTYQEVCDPDASSCTGFFNLKTFLVPKYLQSIPQDPNDTDSTGGVGYSIALDITTNTISIRALKSESGANISINDPLPAEQTITTNIPLAASVPAVPPTNIVTNGLVLNLDAGNPASYPGTGTTWTDLSGNNNNGTLVNGVGYNSANGGSLLFNGSSTYVQVSNSSSLNPSTNTLICWAKSNTSTWNDYGFLISKRDVFVMHPNVGSNTVSYYYFINGWYAQSVTVSNIMNWNMYASSWDGTNITAYLNGVRVVSGSVGGTINTSDTGVTLIGKDDYPGRYLNGNISSCLMYNRALTDLEIQQNFNATRGRFGL